MTKITVLTDNLKFNSNLEGENGLSILVESEDKSIIFDTGSSGVFLRNARSLGVNLDKVDTIVLSHCHQSHTGGVPHFVSEAKKVNIYAHPDIFRRCFRITEMSQKRRVGILWDNSSIEEKGVQFHLSKEPVMLAKNIILTGHIPRITDFEKEPTGFFTGSFDSPIEDMMLDDQALIVKTSKGLIILTGCAHAGIVNTIRYATKLTGEYRIHTVIGGMHMEEMSDERIAKTICWLRDFGITNLVPLCCTGQKASQEFYQQIRHSYRFASAGSSFQIDTQKPSGFRYKTFSMLNSLKRNISAFWF